MRQIADRLISLSAIIGSIGLLAEVLIILVDVVGRALGKPPSDTRCSAART